jgi:hypothetical protein
MKCKSGIFFWTEDIQYARAQVCQSTPTARGQRPLRNEGGNQKPVTKRGGHKPGQGKTVP